jgi:hypothetical protein
MLIIFHSSTKNYNFNEYILYKDRGVYLTLPVLHDKKKKKTFKSNSNVDPALKVGTFYAYGAFFSKDIT